MKYRRPMNPGVHYRVPPTAPLAMRLPAEVYALDGCGCSSGGMGAFDSPLSKILGVVAVVGIGILILKKG